MIGYLVALVSATCAASAFPHFNRSAKLEIIGGNVTNISQVPFAAAAVSSQHTLYCGASIISKNFLLTAAHCCAIRRPLTYRVGSNSFYKGGMLVQVRQKFIHPKYVFNTYPIYDVCLVKTASPLRFERRVQPVQIAMEEPEPGNLAQVAGWGITEKGNVSAVLLSVKVPVTTKRACSKAYPQIEDLSIVFCAGAEGKDSCQGDSGGGLTYNGKLVGVVSFGFGCGINGYPGVYTNILDPSIRGFIRDIAGV